MSQENQEQQNFLSRWSKRKLEKDTELCQHESTEDANEAVNKETRHTEPAAETIAEKELPVWQREDVDAETKKAALRVLFREPKFNFRDGLNEYDDDFTQFASLGDIVTQDMKRMMKLAEEKTRPIQNQEQDPLAETENQQNDDTQDKDFA